ncbi:MAG: hypothetical protein D3920_16245 [Candidatus Electrothrix sp. AW2]|nr:hypothetical protein [Candidatus Electrothrix gigas]MCI5227833.1 hypothetical protein [Candidatus Electrothrix gigas]
MLCLFLQKNCRGNPLWFPGTVRADYELFWTGTGACSYSNIYSSIIDGFIKNQNLYFSATTNQGITNQELKIWAF